MCDLYIIEGMTERSTKCLYFLRFMFNLSRFLGLFLLLRFSCLSLFLFLLVYILIQFSLVFGIRFIYLIISDSINTSTTSPLLTDTK